MLSVLKSGKEDAAKERAEREWSLGRTVTAKMAHFRSVHWKSAAINFDSGLSRWRRSVAKWRYSVFADNEEHREWRHRIRSRHLSDHELALCRRALLRLEQLDHLMVARRTGPGLIQQLVMDLHDDELKVLYLWLEELCQNGEEIALGAPWSFNRHQLRPLLPHCKTAQIPIEYFKLHIADGHDARSPWPAQPASAHKSH